MKKHIANTITSCRILCSIWMLFFPVFSSQFYIAYLLCGLTDIVDGIIARKAKSVTTFGSQFDSVADFIFVTLALIKLLPAMNISSWLWVWIMIILMIKITNLIFGFVHKKRFVFEHTPMNKTTGILLFLLPLTLSFIELKYSAVVVCTVAVFSAIQEGYYIRTGREIV